MSGKGRDDPRNPFPQGIPEPQVGYTEDDVALTQKISRPKLPRIEKIAPSPLDGPPTMLRPKQGGAVDASALKRVRKISSPSHAAVRPAPESPASQAEPTVARPASIPHEAYPNEGAPSTVPDPSGDGRWPSPFEPRIERFDDATQRGPIYVPDDIDVESIRSTRDIEPRSLVTKQVPADVVKILRSRAALENELVMENGLPVLIPDSQASPSSARESSEALMLTKLAPHEQDIPEIVLPAPLVAARPSPLAETRMSPEGPPAVAAQGGPPAPKPSPQLHTLPLGMKPADFLAGLAKAEAHAASQNMQNASMQSASSAALQVRSPSGEMNAVVPSRASGPEVAGAFASSGAMQAAQPSSGVFPQGAQGPGPQRFPSGQMQAVVGPQGHVPPVSGGALPSGTYPPGMAPPVGAYPPGSMPAPSQGPGPYPPGMMQGQQGPGTYPPGMMQAPPQGPGTYPPGMMQAPAGTYPPGMMQAPQQGPGTYPPGMMQAPPAQAFSQGTFPPGSMPMSAPGQAGSPQGTFPPGSMSAPQGPMGGPGQGTFPPGSMSAPQGPQATFPPGSGPVSGAAPDANAQKPRRKSTGVLVFLFLLVVLASVGAWLTIKGKRLPWKHGALPSVAASVVPA